MLGFILTDFSGCGALRVGDRDFFFLYRYPSSSTFFLACSRSVPLFEISVGFSRAILKAASLSLLLYSKRKLPGCRSLYIALSFLIFSTSISTLSFSTIGFSDTYRQKEKNKQYPYCSKVFYKKSIKILRCFRLQK